MCILDFSAADHLGLTPIMWAAASGEINAVMFLMQNDASVNETAFSKSGETALHFACNNGHYRLVRLLLDLGANVNATDSVRCQAVINQLAIDHKMLYTM